VRSIRPAHPRGDPPGGNRRAVRPRPLRSGARGVEGNTSRRAYPAAQPRLMSRRAGCGEKKPAKLGLFGSVPTAQSVKEVGAWRRRPFDRRKIRTMRDPLCRPINRSAGLIAPSRVVINAGGRALVAARERRGHRASNNHLSGRSEPAWDRHRAVPCRAKGN
jgi:hypothetical protein